jgi:hypothetical protein
MVHAAFNPARYSASVMFHRLLSAALLPVLLPATDHHYEALPPISSAVGAKTAVRAPDATRLYVAVSPREGKAGAKLLIYEVD